VPPVETLGNVPIPARQIQIVQTAQAAPSAETSDSSLLVCSETSCGGILHVLVDKDVY